MNIVYDLSTLYSVVRFDLTYMHTIKSGEGVLYPPPPPSWNNERSPPMF